jgi:hypothetical protein
MSSLEKSAMPAQTQSVGSNKYSIYSSSMANIPPEWHFVLTGLRAKDPHLGDIFFNDLSEK